VTQAAVRIRERLDRVGLTSYVKTTGGKGLHVVVPLERRQSWEDMKRFSQRLAHGMATDYPQSYTINSSKRARPGKIYLDFNRNARGANAVAPYSTRARPGAPVATPVAWEELTTALRPDLYNVRNLAERLLNLSADPWTGLDKVRQALTPAILRKI
jgi:bifunctional non-homologous end joining protein LigD